MIEADLLVLLTDQDGLYTADPRADASAELIHEVGPGAIAPALWQAVGGSNSGLGTGGMVTKLQAADLARHAGAAVVIARGSLENILLRIVRGEAIGTHFTPAITSWKAVRSAFWPAAAAKRSW
jgi:glutamate 5-kinase